MAVLTMASLLACIFIQRENFNKLAELYAVHPPMIVSQVDFPDVTPLPKKSAK